MIIKVSVNESVSPVILNGKAMMYAGAKQHCLIFKETPKNICFGLQQHVNMSLKGTYFAFFIYIFALIE